MNEIKQLLIEAGVTHWRCFIIDPMGRAAQDKDLLLTDEQFRDLLNFIVKTRCEGKIGISYACDGYLGAYRPGDDRNEDYNAWGSHIFYEAMLLEYARTGDAAILDAVHRALLWFVENWSGDRKTDYAGPTIIRTMSDVYRLTGDVRLLRFAEEYAAIRDIAGVLSVHNDFDFGNHGAAFSDIVGEEQDITGLDCLIRIDVFPFGFLAVAGDKVARAVEQFEQQGVVNRSHIQMLRIEFFIFERFLIVFVIDRVELQAFGAQ
jgi:hypothetical protein